MARRPTARLVCDVGALDRPDLVAVEALLRLQLTSRRLGRKLRIRHTPPGLRDLLALAGLCDVLPPCSGELPVEPGGKPEQREPSGRVEEERDPGDPVA